MPVETHFLVLLHFSCFDFVREKEAQRVSLVCRFRAHSLPQLLQNCSLCVKEVVSNITEDPVESRTKVE